jgi:thioredoxin reductase (NADPH)
MKTDYDVIIIGAGAAGLSAAQYAARANLSTLVVEELAAGGQALIIDRLENYPGFPETITGMELSRRMEKQAAAFGARFEYATVASVAKEGEAFRVAFPKESKTALAVIVASGAQHKTLGVPGERELMGRGVSYCATCDGPFFKNKRMLVVGGGDAACDEAAYLSNLTDKITHIHRRDRFRAQPALAERILNNPRIDVRFNTECREIIGKEKVAGVKLYDRLENRTYEEETDSVFIFIGSNPRTSFLSGVALDAGGYIRTNDRMETSIPGLFAAGDVRSTPFRQLVVAAGEGAVAAHAAAASIDELRGRPYR